MIFKHIKEADDQLIILYGDDAIQILLNVWEDL